MNSWPKPAKLTNKNPKCECGSGYMPTIMEQSRNRWACNVCYQKAYGPVSVSTENAETEELGAMRLQMKLDYERLVNLRKENAALKEELGALRGRQLGEHAEQWEKLRADQDRFIEKNGNS